MSFYGPLGSSWEFIPGDVAHTQQPHTSMSLHRLSMALKTEYVEGVYRESKARCKMLGSVRKGSFSITRKLGIGVPKSEELTLGAATQGLP